jgi:predicted transcriptional regulator
MSDAMNATSMKDKIVETVKSLPSDATVEDAMERLLFLAKVERGLRQADAGDTIPHSEMKQRFAR